MPTAIIIEDELSAQQLLSNILAEYCAQIKVEDVCTSLSDTLVSIKNKKPDILFLDIELEDCNAFDILNAIDHREYKIIFTTAYDEYAIKAFKYEAVDYLLKPYSPKQVVKAVNKAERRNFNQDILNEILSGLKADHTNKSNKITLSNSKGLVMIEVNNIIRIEADRSYCYVYELGQKKMMVSKPMIEVEKLLPTDHFFRTHSGHIINVNHMRKFSYDEGGYILLNDNSQVPVSRRRRQEFLDFIRNDQ
jgi:two-component system LytT family response regulator